MTAIKIENIKCELNEDVRRRSYLIKVEDVKCRYCFSEKDRVSVEPEKHDREFADFSETTKQPTKYSPTPAKTAAERKRAQRNREKQLKQELGLIRLRGPPKSPAERKRAQREREKQIRKQIDLLYPNRLDKIPGESRKERIEREKQLKLELGFISPRGPPKTPAERKRAQREREKQMRLAIGLVSLQTVKKINSLQKGKQKLAIKSGAVHMQDCGDRKNEQKINFDPLKLMSLPKATAQQKHLQSRKELKPISINTTNIPTEIKSLEWCAEHISKSRIPTGENVKPVQDLEFVDCNKLNSSGSP